jgi:hypothetical protein
MRDNLSRQYLSPFQKSSFLLVILPGVAPPQAASGGVPGMFSSSEVKVFYST